MTKNVRFATAVVLAFVVLLSARPVETLQVSNAAMRERLVAMSALVITRGNVYSVAGNGPVVYAGDEVRLDITIANKTDEQIALGSDTRFWINDVRLTVKKREQARSERATEAIVARPRSSAAGRVVVQPERSTNAQATLQTDTGQALPPGLYIIDVELPGLNREGPGRNINRREVNFEIREPLTRADILDGYLHKAFEARASNRPAEEREWANRALALHPNSLAAWLDLAESYFREGDCKASVPAFNKVIALLTSDGDQEARVSPPASHVVVLQEKLQQCAAKKASP